MSQRIEERLESLRAAIEELRGELHSAVARDRGKLDGGDTYEISERLDKLVAQYLRVKDRLDGEYDACHYVKLRPRFISEEEATPVASIIGTFDSRDRAEKAVGELRKKGFDEDKVSLVAREEHARGGERGTGGITMARGDDLTGGTLTGGAIGGAAGILASLGALAIPGIGPIVAAGPIAAALTGAVTGGVVGGLVDLGIPEERGRFYEGKVKEGKILAVVKADDSKVSEVRDVFRRFDASDIEVH